MAEAIGVIIPVAVFGCTNTPRWSNNCVRDGCFGTNRTAHFRCAPSQFPYGNTPGYFNPGGSDPGWTCAMYGDSRTAWCANGTLVKRFAGGARYNYPENNCCVCGKGKAPPPPPPAPPPPMPLPPVWLCGGACQSGMVFQRNGSRIWGIHGTPSETYTVALDSELVGQAIADSSGKWMVEFSVVKARTNCTINVTSSNGKSAVLEDVGFGEVLLCSGQSNMELQVNGPLSPTQQTRIRVLQLDHFSSPNVTQDTVTWHHSWDGTGSTCQDRCGAPWSQLGKNTQFSAVCKFTGVALFDALGGNVPIGLVESAWGGTRIESWSSPDALSSCPADTTAGCGPPIGGQWARMNSTNSGNLCSAAWNGMLHPILNMRFAAMLWYQGESNLDSFEGTWAGPRNYACRARAALADWRLKMEAPNLPFFFVELAGTSDYDDAEYTFPLLRQASRSFLSLPHTGFITAVDLGCGGGVHSPVKQPDGTRLAVQLRAKVYSQNVVADGPQLDGAPTLFDATLHIRLNNTVDFHMAPVSAAVSGCSKSPFEVGYSNGSWVRVAYTLHPENSTVILMLLKNVRDINTTEVITEVRYAWEGMPQCILYSGSTGNWNSTESGVLPLAPFRVAVSSGCAGTQSACPVLWGQQCCMNSDVKPYLPGGEICTLHGGGCQCRGCVGSNQPL